MVRSESIVRYTADELRAVRARGETRTDYARLDAMTEEELEASIDFDDEGHFDLSQAQPGIPWPKDDITLAVDVDILDHFGERGANVGERMHAVLRAHVDEQRRAARAVANADVSVPNDTHPSADTAGASVEAFG